ncbi:MAG: sulfotransferase domain-containing protein [Pseudomonadota bacterium]
MKLALVSTPRSGNTWLRYLLAGLYGMQQHSVHTPEALDWNAMGENSIVQLHWHREPAFLELLASHGFEVLTIARHPLAVLLSIWQFAPHEPQTANWLSGEGGDETSILNRPVDSAEFLRYACGPRARALLSVTPEWWHAPGVLKVRYEDLVAQPHRTLTELGAQFGPVVRTIDEVLGANTIDKLKLTTTNSHFWQGEPDAWRRMIPQEFWAKIVDAHADVFESLGYTLEPR